jgi:hypothetical protein
VSRRCRIPFPFAATARGASHTAFSQQDVAFHRVAPPAIGMAGPLQQEGIMPKRIVWSLDHETEYEVIRR